MHRGLKAVWNVKCIVPDQCAFVGQALNRWRSRVEEAADARAKLRKAAKRMQACKLAAAFGTWVQHAASAHRLRRLELVSQAHRERQLMRSALQTWRGLPRGAQRHRSKLLMETALQRLQQRELAAALHTWRMNTQEVARERRLLVRSAARFQRRLMFSAFAQLREASQVQRRQKRVVSKCLARVRNRQLAQVPHTLLISLSPSSVCYTAPLSCFLNFHMCPKLLHEPLQAFEAFKGMHAESMERRQKLALALGKLADSMLAKAFSRWKLCLVERRERLQRLRVVASRWTQLTLSHAFNSWSVAVKEIGAERADRVARLVPSIRNAFTPTLRAAFGAWRGLAAGEGLAERERRLLMNVLQRMRLQRAAVVFDTWYEHAHEQRQRKHRLLMHIGSRVLSQAFAQWCALLASLYFAVLLLLLLL